LLFGRAAAGAPRTAALLQPQTAPAFTGNFTNLSGATLKRVGDVTRIREAVQQGDPTAADQLLPLA